jgi:hypothetical protein
VEENMSIATAVLLVLIVITAFAITEYLGVRDAIVRTHKRKIADGRFPAPLHGQIVEGHTRVELFEWYPLHVGFGFFIGGIAFMVLPILVCLSALMHPRPSQKSWWGLLLFFAVFAACGALFAILGAHILRWRKRYKNRPLVVIDDAGLWLRKVGELMPWSEIQSVKLEFANPDALFFVIVWRDQRYEFGAGLLDRNGVQWWARDIREEIEERWQRNRHASSVPADSDRVARSLQ